MKFKIETTVLKDALKKIDCVNTSNITLHACSNILIEVKEKSVVLSSTNLETSVSIECLAEVEERNRACLINKKLFSKIITDIKDEYITIEEKDYWMTINDSANCVCSDPDDFSVISEVNNFLFTVDNSNELFAAMKKSCVIYFNKFEKKLHIKNILFKVESNKIKLISTDGGQMSIIDLSEKIVCDSNYDFMLSKQEVKNIDKLFIKNQRIHFLSSDSFLCMKGEDGLQKVIFRLIECAFPDYKSLINQKDKFNKLVLDKNKFLSILKSMLSYVDDDYKAVRLVINKGELLCSVTNPNIGEIGKKIVVNSKEEFDALFNLKYLISQVNCVEEDNILISFNGDEHVMFIEKHEKKNVGLIKNIIKSKCDSQYLGIIALMKMD